MNKDTRLTEGKVRKGGLGSMPLTPPPPPPKGQNPMVMDNCPYCGAESISDNPIQFACGSRTGYSQKKYNQSDPCLIRELEQEVVKLQVMVVEYKNFKITVRRAAIDLIDSAQNLDALDKEPDDAVCECGAPLKDCEDHRKHIGYHQKHMPGE